MRDKRFDLRRRMATVSFYTVIVLIFTLLGLVFFGTSSVASNLTAATGILIALITSLTGIIGHYNHMVYSTDRQDSNKKEE